MKKVIGVITAVANRRRHVLVNSGIGFFSFAVGDALSQGAREPLPLPVSVLVGQEVAVEPSLGQQLMERYVSLWTP